MVFKFKNNSGTQSLFRPKWREVENTKKTEGKYPSNYVFLNNYDLNTYVSNSQNISDETFLREIHIENRE